MEYNIVRFNTFHLTYMYIIGYYSVLGIMEATCSNADTDKDKVNFLSDELSLSVEYVCLGGFAQLENFSLIWKGHHDHAGLSDTYTRGYTFFYQQRS